MSASTDRRLLSGLLHFVKPHLRLLLLGSTVFPLYAAVRIAGPLILKAAIDGPIHKGNLSGLAVLAFGYLAIVALGGVLDLAKNYVMQLAGQRMVSDVRSTLFERVARLAMGYVDRQPSGKLLSRITNDTESLNEFLSSGLVTIAADALMLIGIVGVMLSLDVKLTLYSLALLPPLIFGVALARQLMRDIFLRLSQANAESTAYAAEALAGITVVQAFRREETAASEFDALSDKGLVEDLRGVLWSSQLSAVVELAAFLSVGVLLYFSAESKVSLGVLVAFIEYIQLFYRPVESLSGRFAVLQKALASAEKIFGLLGDAEDHIDAPGNVPTPALKDAIRFEDVDFSYVPGTPVLRGLKLELHRGETVALVGATGAGKSSIIKLLARFYQPSAGRVTWDGQDIAEFERGSLRRRIGFVPQETFLFRDTLGANIALGNATPEAVEAAAKTVRADRVARDLPLGYNQTIGEGGRSLSAGERQLIAFARALAQDPDVLILDEATATIDGETEAVIQEALAKLLAGRTAVVIAHRLSTIRDADRIVVMHKGELREQGSHEELIAAKGLYETLYRLQGGSVD